MPGLALVVGSVWTGACASPSAEGLPPSELVPTVADLGDPWTLGVNETGAEAYESVLVRCATGRSDLQIEGLGTFFEAENGGVLYPVALRLESTSQAAEALRQVQSKAFTDCLDREAADDPTNLFFDDAQYVRSLRGEVLDLSPLVDDGTVDEAIWVQFETEIAKPDGSPDGPITTGVMVVRQGRDVQLSRVNGIASQATADSTADTLLRLFPSPN